jgi:hypothetical protein
MLLSSIKEKRKMISNLYGLLRISNLYYIMKNYSLFLDECVPLFLGWKLMLFALVVCTSSRIPEDRRIEMAQGVHQAVKSTKLGAGKGRISHVKKTQ